MRSKRTLIALTGIGAVVLLAGFVAVPLVISRSEPSGQAMPTAPSERSGSSAPAVPATGDSALPTQSKVVRTAEARISAPKGGMETARHALGDRVSAAGGYLSGADVQSGGDGGPSASLTYMLPQERFQGLLDDLGRVGTVQSLHVTSSNVSEEYVDLQSRLRSLEAQQAAMEALLGRASTVQDVITIRQQLGPIQDQIEQVKGRIDQLDHATSYFTLTVTLVESGALSSADETGLRTALAQGWHNLLAVIDFLVVALVSLSPFLVAGALVGVVLLRRRRSAVGVHGGAVR